MGRSQKRHTDVQRNIHADGNPNHKLEVKNHTYKINNNKAEQNVKNQG